MLHQVPSSIDNKRFISCYILVNIVELKKLWKKFYKLLDKKNNSLTENHMYPTSYLLENIALILRLLRKKCDSLRRAGIILLAKRKIVVDIQGFREFIIHIHHLRKIVKKNRKIL